MREPFITPDLEDMPGETPEFFAAVLRCLAKQLTYANDFYVPLVDLARRLDGKTTREAEGGGQ